MKFFLAILTLSACVSVRSYPPSVETRTKASFTLEAENGMVASAHPLASKAGAAILKQGGNAMDAAIAVSFVISVVRPQSTGIGGGGFLLYFDKASGLTKVYDFRERAPLKATRNMYLNRKGKPKDFYYKGKKVPNASVNGHLSVGVPGLIAGLVESHKRHGRLPFKTLVQPAIDIASNGFPVYKSLAAALVRRQAILANFEDSRAIFMPGGKLLKEGDTLVQKDLAKTLKIIQAKGRDGFYKGSVARNIIREMRRGKGIIGYKDLSRYRVKLRTPVTGTYRGHKVVSMPPPSSGGVHIVQILNMLEGYDVKSLGYGSADGMHLLAETMRRAFADRAKYLGDPDFVKVPTKGLTSKAYAKSIAASIDMQKASSSKVVGAGNPVPHESSSTTHLSVVDKWGNAVSSTQTVNYSFGSGVVAKGTGIVLNDEMDDFSKKPGVPNVFGLVGSEANAIAAKKTMLSSMSPTIVFDPKGELELVVGSPGGPRILTATLQTIVNYIDHGMSLTDAVHAFRIHHQWLPDMLFIEPNGLDSDVRKTLEKRGHKIKERGNIGDVQAVARTDEGWIGVTDTRSEGFPAGL